MELLIFNEDNKPTHETKNKIADFLYTSLEQYGDPKDQILSAMDYALKESTSFGGFIVVAEEADKIIGATVINKTGMKGYIPENILVYIATDANQRGKGIGRAIMEKAIATAEGDIALHVEQNNPAKKLYEKLGFTNPYLEMRLKKTNQ